jgi:methylthioribose-1-phosphate isomerase
MARTIYWEDGAAMILDQTKLPHEVTYVKCTDYHMVCECIVNMRIRGAPAIGIAASMGIALGANGIKAGDYDAFTRELEDVYKTLLATRPTAVNIEWAVDRMRFFLKQHKSEPVDKLKQMLVDEAEKVLEEDIEVNKTIGKYGAQFIKEGARILTHCNAGGLATGGYGTATGPMRTAHAEGKRIHVYADETRPLLQGARLTAWELKDSGIPVTLITDNCAGALMCRGEIDLVPHEQH